MSSISARGILNAYFWECRGNAFCFLERFCLDLCEHISLLLALYISVCRLSCFCCVLLSEPPTYQCYAGHEIWLFRRVLSRSPQPKGLLRASFAGVKELVYHWNLGEDFFDRLGNGLPSAPSDFSFLANVYDELVGLDWNHNRSFFSTSWVWARAAWSRNLNLRLDCSSSGPVLYSLLLLFRYWIRSPAVQTAHTRWSFLHLLLQGRGYLVRSSSDTWHTRSQRSTTDHWTAVSTLL